MRVITTTLREHARHLPVIVAAILSAPCLYYLANSISLTCARQNKNEQNRNAIIVRCVKEKQTIVIAARTPGGWGDVHIIG